MKKLLMAILFAAGLLFVLPTSASADDNINNAGSTLRHAYQPTTVATTQMMRARVDNFSTSAQKRLVCVEAFNNASNVKTHLGCLWVELDPMGGKNWAAEFDAPTNWLRPGSYTVVYTYQDDSGNWQRIRSLTLQQQDGMYVAR